MGTYLRRLEGDEEKFNWFVVALLFVVALNIPKHDSNAVDLGVPLRQEVIEAYLSS